MQLSHIARRSLAPGVFALTVFFAPHLLAGAEDMLALWRDVPAANEPISGSGPDAAPMTPSLQDLFAYSDHGPVRDEPGSVELDAATQAALDDALRHFASRDVAEAM